MGHRLIAEIAFENLTPQAKTKVQYLEAIFKHHYHHYRQFNDMAIWPDDLMRRGIKIFSQWHYINIPFSPDHTQLPAMDKQNVVWAIQQSEQVLKDTQAKPFEKALFLAFLVHFVGDVHQPMHCVNRITHQHPQGDFGGNLFLLKHGHHVGKLRSVIPVSHWSMQQKDLSLHHFWDMAGGLYKKLLKGKSPADFRIHKIASNLQKEYSKKYFGRKVQDMNPSHWARESFWFAKNVAYCGLSNHELNKKYIAQVQSLSKRRIVLAGYRLAYLLNAVLR